MHTILVTFMLVKSDTLSTKKQGCLIGLTHGVAMLSNEFIPCPTFDVVESRVQE